MKILFDKDTWQEIFSSINQNQIRTMITIIGVLWGIFLYIVLSGAAKGVENGFERNFERISSNSLFVWGGNTTIPYEGFKSDRAIRLTLDDVETLKNKIEEIKYIAPRIQRGNFGSQGANIKRNKNSGIYNIYGDYPIFITVATKTVYDGGRFISEMDIKNSRKVCVIGERTKKELFEEKEDPIGKFISINNVYFKVIGIHKYVEEGGNFNTDGDIHIPFSTFRKLYNTGDNVGFLLIAGFDDVDIIQVEKKVKTVLKEVHYISPDDNQALGGFNLGALFNRIKGFAEGMSFISLIIGLATMLAGVIGIDIINIC